LNSEFQNINMPIALLKMSSHSLKNEDSQDLKVIDVIKIKKFSNRTMSEETSEIKFAQLKNFDTFEDGFLRIGEKDHDLKEYQTTNSQMFHQINQLHKLLFTCSLIFVGSREEKEMLQDLLGNSFTICVIH
jgi:hypothetical protein